MQENTTIDEMGIEVCSHLSPHALHDDNPKDLEDACGSHSAIIQKKAHRQYGEYQYHLPLACD